MHTVTYKSNHQPTESDTPREIVWIEGPRQKVWWIIDESAQRVSGWDYSLRAALRHANFLDRLASEA